MMNHRPQPLPRSHLHSAGYVSAVIKRARQSRLTSNQLRHALNHILESNNDAREICNRLQQQGMIDMAAARASTPLCNVDHIWAETVLHWKEQALKHEAELHALIQLQLQTAQQQRDEAIKKHHSDGISNSGVGGQNGVDESLSQHVRPAMQDTSTQTAAILSVEKKIQTEADSALMCGQCEELSSELATRTRQNLQLKNLMERMQRSFEQSMQMRQRPLYQRHAMIYTHIPTPTMPFDESDTNGEEEPDMSSARASSCSALPVVGVIDETEPGEEQEEVSAPQHKPDRASSLAEGAAAVGVIFHDEEMEDQHGPAHVGSMAEESGDVGVIVEEDEDADVDADEVKQQQHVHATDTSGQSMQANAVSTLRAGEMSMAMEIDVQQDEKKADQATEVRKTQQFMAGQV